MSKPLTIFLSFIMIGSILEGSFVSPILGKTQGEFPQKNYWTRLTPSVAWCGEDPMLEVHIVGRTDVKDIYIINSGGTPLERLYDDGTHGDKTAGDFVFTIDAFNLEKTSIGASKSKAWCEDFANGYRSFYLTSDFFLKFKLQDETSFDSYFPIRLIRVHTALKGVFETKELGNGLSATSHAFFIEDAANEVIDSYPVSNVYCGTSNFMAYQKLYSVMPDAFDIAVVMPGMQIWRPSDFAENVPYQILVSNNVQNIGLPQLDKSAQFGSAGRLKSTVFHSFGSIAIMDHELAHTWGASIGSSLRLLDGDGTHWNPLSDINGQLSAYYFDPGGKTGTFSDNGDNTWRFMPNTSSNLPYSPLELYAMGLIPSSEVPPIHLLNNPDLSNLRNVTAASIKTISMEDVLRVMGGERIPPAIDAQKDFGMVFIIIQDTPFNDAAHAYFSILAMAMEDRSDPRESSQEAFFAPFYWATGGRGTLTTRLPIDLQDPKLPNRSSTESPTSQPQTEVTPESETNSDNASTPTIPNCWFVPFALILWTLTVKNKKWGA